MQIDRRILVALSVAMAASLTTAHVAAADIRRPFLTCQAQFYPISEKDIGYISRWHDVPLLLDNSLPKARDSRRMSWSEQELEASTKELLEYGFDGFSFFPTSHNRFGAFYMVQDGYGKGAVFVPIVQPGQKDGTYTADEIWQGVLANPGLEIGGRKVVFGYKTVAMCGKDPQKLATACAQLRAKYGDRFLFMADMEFLTRLRYSFAANGKLSEKEHEDACEQIRKWLRATDGAYYGEVHMLQKNLRDERVFFAEFYREVVIKLLRAVLDEPEFKGRKLLGLAALVGHENNCQWGYYCSHDGTKTLRRSFAAARDARPDYINFCEWDEVNENTCICPTFRSGRSTKRILRAMFADMRGEAQSPLPGDDTSVPNLVLSARAVVAYGEALNVEVLAVPDGASGDIGIQLALLDENGIPIKEFPREVLRADRLADRTYEIASEELAPHRVVRYRLATDYGGKRRVWEEGLPFTELRTCAAWCYRWNKAPLREIVQGCGGSGLSIGAAAADGLVPIDVKVEADEPLAYVGLVENDELVAVRDPDGFEDSWRESDSNWVFAVTFFSERDMRADGIVFASGLGGGVIPEWRSAKAVSHGMSVPLDRVSRWNRDLLLKVPKSADISRAEIVVDTPVLPNMRIPLAAVVRHGAFNRPGGNGMSVTVDRYRFQVKFPARRLGGKKAAFRTFTLPSAEDSVLHVFGVTASGRIWRGAPMLLGGAPQSEKRIMARSAVKEKAVEISVPKCQAPRVTWDFSGKAGNIMANVGGNRYQNAILGAPATCATFANRYFGHLCSNPFKIPEYVLVKPKDGPSSAPRTYPLRLSEEGIDFLRFSEWNYMLLPQGVLPRNAGWDVAFKMRPKAIRGIQTPFACRWGNGTPGSFWMSILPNGRMRLDYAGLANVHTRREFPVKAKAGEWNDVIVRYRIDTIELEMNGWKSGPVSCVSPGRHDLLVMVGGYQTEWYEGDIACLSVETR